MFMFDAVVIVVSILTYLSYREGMYTLVAVFIGAKVIDFMQEGAYAAKGATIISDKTMKLLPKFYLKWSAEQPFKKLLDRIQKWNVMYCIALLLK